MPGVSQVMQLEACAAAKRGGGGEGGWLTHTFSQDKDLILPSVKKGSRQSLGKINGEPLI